MEINHNNNIIPEFHVAQQRRRDKLRVQQFDELQQSNNFPHHHSYTFIPPPPPDMLSSAVSQSSTATPFPNIHPTRYVASSSSDSCDPQHQLQQQQLQQQQLQGYEAWVVPHYLVNHSSQTPETDGYHSNALSWGNGNNGGSGSGTGTGSELPLLPANFVSHQTDNVGTHPHDRGLSLSLSSNQICEYQHLNSNDPPEFKPFESGTISSVVKQSMSCSGKLACGSSQVQDVSFQVHRNVGPLGPFTGYASILKSSKFLKPAQQLLDEFFGVAGSWRRGDDDENDQSLAISRSHNMDDLSGRSCSESYRPDCHERKAKLLHMQEEVCKRHKQYHQQMEMVISAFDSVPGLSNATPYISRSIKTISRHFRCLKNAIADQLKHIKRALGEDFASPPGFLKGDSSSSLRYDPNFAKARSGAIGGAGHVGHQSHVWRPQRGLPERAVSILRAWLFDHFLHPYPTDNDKQMLATQTGLTRNQVSNWFINARVRLWKPMVEEIHTLETKASSRSDHNSNNSVMSIIEIQAAAANQSGCKASSLNPVCDKQSERLGSSSSLEQSRGETINTEQLFQKCSRIESHQLPTNVDGSFIRFLPYQRRGLELGGIGAVSLTLGLRHGSETTQQQLQHQFIPQGMPFGGHVIHDYSG